MAHLLQGVMAKMAKIPVLRLKKGARSLMTHLKRFFRQA